MRESGKRSLEHKSRSHEFSRRGLDRLSLLPGYTVYSLVRTFVYICTKPVDSLNRHKSLPNWNVQTRTNNSIIFENSVKKTFLFLLVKKIRASHITTAVFSRDYYYFCVGAEKTAQFIC